MMLVKNAVKPFLKIIDSNNPMIHVYFVMFMVFLICYSHVI